MPDPDPGDFQLMGEPDDTRIHYGGPSIKNRANFRSATPMGFAREVCDANAKDTQ